MGLIVADSWLQKSVKIRSIRVSYLPSCPAERAPQYGMNNARIFTKLAVMKRLIAIICLLVGLEALAAPPQAVFIPNLGQFEGKHHHQAGFGKTTLFFEKNSVRIALLDAANWHDAHQLGAAGAPSTILKGHNLALQFEGSNPHTEVALGGSEKAPAYTYLQGPKTHRTRPGSSLRYRELYSGIDMLWKLEAGKMKYDFEVKVGADPSRIRLRYQGAEAVSLRKGQLVVKTSVGDWVEAAPVAYQMLGQKKLEVACAFVLKQGEISFQFPKGYNKNLPLIIDPTLVFSSYSGATSDNWGFTACSDLASNIYTGGIAFGPGYPVSLGAYQTNWNGNTIDANNLLHFDIALMKYSSTGDQLLYATFLGGNRVERPHSLVANDQGELYIMGSTNSTDFPMGGSGFDKSHNGQYDIFVSKLSADGSQLMASTFFGGAQNDGLNLSANLRSSPADEFRGDVFIASSGDVMVASMSGSQGLGTIPAYQPTYGGGQTDGLIIRFSNDLQTLRWASYLGGNAADALYSVKEGSSGEVVVAGGSASPFTLPGFGYQTSNAGGTDGMVARFQAADGQGISGTFLGSAGYDQLFFIDIDGVGDVYVNGHTDSNLVTFGTNYNDPRSGQYIGCFSSQLGTLRWLGRYGARTGKPELNLAAFVVDLCQNVYASGFTGNILGNTLAGPTNFQLTNNARQTTTDGLDFYLAAFSPGMLTLQYSSYLGGAASADHVDGGTSRFDKRGVMYQAVCAGCGGLDDFPVTPNAYADSNGSSNCNNAVFKLAFELESGLGARFGWVDPPTWCAPLSLQLQDFSRTIGSTSYQWISGAGDTSTLQNPVFNYEAPGTYRILLRISSPTACNGFDTLSRTITVFAPPALELPNDTCLCVEDGYRLSSNIPGRTFDWSGAMNSTDISIIPTETGTYRLTLTDDNGCSASDSVNLVVIPCFGTITNVITPNGDNLNDRLTLPGTNYDDFTMRVFNRWGQEVFSTRNQALGWGGENAMGGKLGAGDYFVRISARFCTNRITERDFPVKLIR